MCGIVGYIGNKKVDIELIESLKKLEYRGYDSSGLSMIVDGNIKTLKAEGKIANLEEIITGESNAKLGIAHTRWATHGSPTTTNAHPHNSSDKKWSIVHNGIIENFQDLKQNLINDKSVNFVSETDTEVIVQQLQHLYNGNILQTVIETCKQLIGSFALAILNVENPNSLYLAKRKSPLYVAKTETEIFVASDPICFVGKAKNYYSMDDNEFCEASIENLEFYNHNGEVIEKQAIDLTIQEENYGKNNYSHFMLKEIMEVPQVLNRITKTYNDNCVFSKLDKNKLNEINKVILVGCGTAYHACLMGASYIEKFAKIDCRALIASEFRYSDPIIDNKTLAIFVSQSGETADTIMAQNLAKEKSATTVGVTNVLYSTLAKSVDFVLPVCAGPEIAVASTKAYTAQITVLYMFAKYLDNVRNNKCYDFISDVIKLSEYNITENEKQIEYIANELVKNDKTVFFIGRNWDYITATEASLKLKEITYINSQSYPAGELKHGYLALVEKDSIVFVIATKKDLFDKTLNASFEASARGAKIVLISQFDIPQDKRDSFFDIIKLSDMDENLMSISSIATFQILAYLTSIKKNINPDQPRNLAKSVTVE